MRKTVDKATLTPVERGLLLALMAAGRPLKNAEIQKKYRFTVKGSHRAKLKKLGLVRVTPSPWTLEITEEGWAWAQTELNNAKAGMVPKGTMGLGALYALLAGARDGLDRLQVSPREFFGGEPSVVDASTNGAAETAWALADDSLARALQQTPRLRVAVDPSKGLDKELRSFIGETIDALRHAARAREMVIEGGLDDIVDFDPRIHADDDPRARVGTSVRIVRPAIAQGEGSYRRILRKAQVDIVG